jgi:hypothetical protein
MEEVPLAMNRIGAVIKNAAIKWNAALAAWADLKRGPPVLRWMVRPYMPFGFDSAVDA